MIYNVRVKTYPDGHKQYFWSDEPIFRLDEENDSPELVESVKKRRKQAALNRAVHSFDVVDVDDPDSEGEEFTRRRWNLSRAVQVVYDIARSNSFQWFITLTINGEKIDRYDYDSCSKAVQLFTRRLAKLGCKWLIVPEQHKDGAYHFHGLVAGDLPLTPSGKTCYNEAEQKELPIYNLANYEFGFTTVTQIIQPDRTASYIAKYLTKQIAVPKGKKCYWASRSLARPTVEYMSTYRDVPVVDEDTGDLTYIRDYQDSDWVFGFPSGIRYVKEIENEYGRFVISEE